RTTFSKAPSPCSSSRPWLAVPSTDTASLFISRWFQRTSFALRKARSIPRFTAWSRTDGSAPTGAQQKTIVALATIASHPPVASSLPKKKRIGNASRRPWPRFSDSLEREVYRVFHCTIEGPVAEGTIGPRTRRRVALPPLDARCGQSRRGHVVRGRPHRCTKALRQYYAPQGRHSRRGHHWLARRVRPRFPLCAPHAATQPGLHRRRRTHARSRHRRQHRHFQRGGRHSSASAALSGARAAGPRVGVFHQA